MYTKLSYKPSSSENDSDNRLKGLKSAEKHPNLSTTIEPHEVLFSNSSDTSSSSQSEEDLDLIRVLLVEDQEVVRLGLKMGFQVTSQIEIVGEATTGPMAIEKSRALKPDVIIMDVGLPIFDGIVATKKIKSESSSKILMLTSHSDDQTVVSALQSGADGFCLKDTSTDNLITAIQAVAQGGTWISDGLVQKIASKTSYVDPNSTVQQSDLQEIDKRVLDAVFGGKSMQDIASEFDITLPEAMSVTRKVLQKVTFSDEEKVPSNDRKITNEHQMARVCECCRTPFDIDQIECPFDGAKTTVDSYIGTIFAERYEILSILGCGTGGTVYKARHKFINKYVAIKVMNLEHVQDLDMLQRFRVEAATSCALQHENIVSVHDFGFTKQGKPFMIMDYVEGCTLDDILEEEVFLPAHVAIQIFEQICDALQVAHDKGIIHRDIKPGNVIISGYNTNSMTVKLADFGIAKLTKPIMGEKPVKTDVGKIFGSPYYMSPEQCTGGEIDHLTDIFSLGCLMFTTLVGHPPVEGRDAIEVLHKKVHEKVPKISETTIGKNLPIYLQVVVMRTMRYVKTERIQSAYELKQLLVDLKKQFEDSSIPYFVEQ